MRPRRTAAAVLATLTALLVSPAATAAPPPAKDEPLSVEAGQVRCHNLSTLATLVPGLADFFGQDLSSVPSMRFTIRAARYASSTPFEITVNGETKSRGIVSSGGVVITSIALPDQSEVTVAVRSENTVLLQRTVTTDCR